MSAKLEKKMKYVQKLCGLLEKHTKILIALADNVGSNQLQKIRMGLHGDTTILMGKNTLMRRGIRMHAEKSGNTAYLNMIPLIVGNVALIFTHGDLGKLIEEIAKYNVASPARVGHAAPIDVVVPPGNTGLHPSQDSFFQELNIPTKIKKGAIEIINPVELIKKGQKVGPSEAALLAKLGIKPFSYGLVVKFVFDDGSVYKITEEYLMEKFLETLSTVTSLSAALSLQPSASSE